MSEYAIRLARAADAAAIARVHTESWRTTYAGVMPEEFLARISVERRAKAWQAWLREMEGGARKRILVAIAPSGEVVGLLSGGESRDAELHGYDGELYAVYILQTHQRRGLGSRFVREFATWVEQQGLGDFFLWVLEGNPYETFYPKVGGVKLDVSKPIEFGGKLFREHAYGWRKDTAAQPRA